MVGAKCKVSLDAPNSLASVFGFKRSIYGVGRHASVNSILVHCNIINSSYMRGTQAPHNLIYLPVTVDVISTLSVWLTDQHGKLLDMRGEELTIRFHLRER